MWLRRARWSVEWRKTAALHLGHSNDLAAFLTASEAAQLRATPRRRRLFARISLLAAVTSVLATVAWDKAREAERKSGEAIAAKLIAEDRLSQKVKADEAREAAERIAKAVEQAA